MSAFPRPPAFAVTACEGVCEHGPRLEANAHPMRPLSTVLARQHAHFVFGALRLAHEADGVFHACRLTAARARVALEDAPLRVRDHALGVLQLLQALLPVDPLRVDGVDSPQGLSELRLWSAFLSSQPSASARRNCFLADADVMPSVPAFKAAFFWSLKLTRFRAFAVMRELRSASSSGVTSSSPLLSRSSWISTASLFNSAISLSQRVSPSAVCAAGNLRAGASSSSSSSLGVLPLAPERAGLLIAGAARAAIILP
eukprot:CAMPEP_0181375018 /NCGR_PEP_ID=MMETSP1106-20121128/16386_1 /TAXON_ID=81844 /ORGANISM="Mantoniella antarctica, Strain SL-175" /LENGTH=256 /DNA_ID=CAMNT_0023493151 /DNA_START=2845 /DNA_END=3612 /DNA_ORIENTATION=-